MSSNKLILVYQWILLKIFHEKIRLINIGIRVYANTDTMCDKFGKIQYDRGLHLKMDTFFQTKTTHQKTMHRKTTRHKTTRQKYVS